MKFNMPKQARGLLCGRIGSDGWGKCDGCGPVLEPVFPHTYQDMDGPVTVYYCKYCFNYVEGHPLEDRNTYDEERIPTLNYVDWLMGRNRRRKIIKEIYGTTECPNCEGRGRVRNK